MNLRIIAQAFVLSRIAARHYIKCVAIFAEPYRSWNCDARSAICDQRNIFFAQKSFRYRHAGILQPMVAM